jgi:Mg2+/citrate symporter
MDAAGNILGLVPVVLAAGITLGVWELEKKLLVGPGSIQDIKIKSLSEVV